MGLAQFYVLLLTDRTYSCVTEKGSRENQTHPNNFYVNKIMMVSFDFSLSSIIYTYIYQSLHLLFMLSLN